MGDPITIHGFTAVPHSTKELFDGKSYINKPTPLLVKDLAFPADDPLVSRIQAYAKTELLVEIYNHSMRVYYFGLAILRQQFPAHATLSPSTLALTALLHDIGATPTSLHVTRLSFEFYGGLVALYVLLKADRPDGDGVDGGRKAALSENLDARAQAEAVVEAIIRHHDVGETGKITILGQVLQLATTYDDMTTNSELIHPDTLADVIAHFPRKGWSRCFTDTIRYENRVKPWAHATALEEKEFPEGVKGNEFMEKYD